MLKEELANQSAWLESYLSVSGGVGIVLLDAMLNILDCSQGFSRMFDLKQKPSGRPLTDFLNVEADGLKQTGEFKLSCTSHSGVSGVLHCFATELENGYLLACERLLLTESRSMEQIGIINNDLITLQRESVKKNLLLEKLRRELDQRIAELEATLAQVKQLEGIIPICMYCKKIRDDQDSWQQLEKYITEHSEAFFSHGICPECAEDQIKLLTKLKIKQ